MNIDAGAILASMAQQQKAGVAALQRRNEYQSRDHSDDCSYCGRDREGEAQDCRGCGAPC